MGKDLRASLIASGAAAVLSMIVGIASGIGFLVILLRAFLGALAFGAIVYGAFFLARRFLPELFESGEGAERPAEPEAGASVNIVLPGEGLGEDQPAEAEELGLEGGLGLAAAEGPHVGAARDDSSGAARGAARGEEAAPPRRGPRQKRPSGAQPLGAGEDEDFSFAGESLLDDAESVEEAKPAPLQAPRISEGIDSLDVLPDLESLSEGFGPVAADNGVEVHEYEESAPRSRAQAGSASGSDPAMLAQAVRTLLKRDQER